MPDHPLFSSPGATTAPSTTNHPRTTHASGDQDLDLGLNKHGEVRRSANPGDERTVDPTDRRRRARSALRDLQKDTIFRTLER
ncbi:hypothetical protein [Cellulosimicrobium arenosum]|uniref:Uncharacterized protein n=1 Tax=Cellulosimicrobium arenosum TaxID=2708133 RepID=A0A927J0E4_9MICO|nr:hypothetical protein [Cellulosimicrobium arenosum]MBD8079556.1 hypothetical protein [Cellulosimicrobium arenosum]